MSGHNQSTEKRNVQTFSGWGAAMMREKPTAEYVLASDYDAERLKRQQAEHERDAAIENVKRLQMDIENLKHYTGVYSQGWRSPYARPVLDVTGDSA